MRRYSALAVLASFFVTGVLIAPARADLDFPDGDSGQAHESRHQDYERSDDVDEAAFLALLIGGKKTWLCSIVGPHKGRNNSAVVPDKDVLEEMAIYSFARDKKDAITASVRDISVGKLLDRLIGKKPPFMKARKESCQFEGNQLLCEGPGGIRQYVRHFTDPVGIVYLLIENTHGAQPASGTTLPPSKSNADRFLGSLYHCLSRPI